MKLSAKKLGGKKKATAKPAIRVADLKAQIAALEQGAVAELTGRRKALHAELAAVDAELSRLTGATFAKAPLNSDSPERRPYTPRAAVTGKTPDLQELKQIIPAARKDRKEQGKRPDFDSPEFFTALTSHFYAAKREALGRE